MWELIIDHLGLIIIGGGFGIAMLAGLIQRIRERKYRMDAPEDRDVPGTAGKVIGNAVYRGMPTDITGMPPSGHFQKPDFSYDEKSESAYSEKYENRQREQQKNVCGTGGPYVGKE